MNIKEFNQRLAEMKPYEKIFTRELFRDNIPLTELVFRIITKKNDLKISSQVSDFEPEEYDPMLCLEAVGSDDSGQDYILLLFSSHGIFTYQISPYLSATVKYGHKYWNGGHKPRNGKPPVIYALYVSDRDTFFSSNWIINGEFIDENNNPIGLGVHMLFINCEGDKTELDTDTGKLSHDFSCTNAKDMFFDIMADRTAHLKTEPDGIKYMYEIFERNGDNI